MDASKDAKFRLLWETKSFPSRWLCERGWFMPRYYFHIRNGFELIEDPEGIELPAKSEAEEAARELLASKVKSGDIIDGQEFEIHDGWGNRLLRVPFKSALRLK